jgi:hypothetical protein
MEMKEIVVNNSAKTTASQAASLGHNQPPLDTGLVTVALDELSVWPVAQEQADDVTEDVIDVEVAILAEAGQRVPLSARQTENGQIEVVAAAHVLTAIRRHNELYPEKPLKVEVRVLQMRNAATPFRTLAQQIEPSHAASSLARGRFYLHAVAAFGDEAAVAKHCRVSAGAISKNLDVVRAHAHVKDKVLIARDISQRDGMWLMKVIGRDDAGTKAKDAEARANVLAAIAALPATNPLPAAKLFAQLRTAERGAKASKADRWLHHGDRAVARMRVKKGQIVGIDLADVGDIELDTLMGIIREELASARRKRI